MTAGDLESHSGERFGRTSPALSLPTYQHLGSFPLRFWHQHLDRSDSRRFRLATGTASAELACGEMATPPKWQPQHGQPRNRAAFHRQGERNLGDRLALREFPEILPWGCLPGSELSTGNRNRPRVALVAQLDRARLS